MFILTINGREEEGAYSVTDDDGDQILYLFAEEDDASRYAMMLEENGYPEMHVIEIEDDTDGIVSGQYLVTINKK